MRGERKKSHYVSERYASVFKERPMVSRWRALGEIGRRRDTTTADRRVGGNGGGYGPLVKGAHADRRRWLTSLSALAVIGLVAAGAGCSSSTGGPSGSSAPAAAKTTSAPQPPKVTITPTDAMTGVTVTTAVVVRSDVPLASVEVTRGASASESTPAGSLAGAFSANRLTWTSTGGLFAGSRYQVVATSAAAAGFRGTTTARSTFTTGVPSLPFKVSWDPVDSQTVGIGAPVTLTFNAPVRDRAAVQRRLAVTSTPAVVGAWNWASDTVVRYRPRQYWPAGERVHVEANLAGYDNGGGRLGVKDRQMTFTIGARHISYVDAATFRMKVYSNGRLVKEFPVSLGRERYPTMDGPHNVIAVAPVVTMDSATVGIPKGNPDYYYEKVNWDVQITSGGEYVHAAPWSVGSQGRANVSHGCVNASDADAEWFYRFSRVGDIVQVANTGRPPDTSQLGNEWSVPWSTWKAGSALPVTSTTPSPTTVPGGSSAAGPAVGASPGASTPTG